MVARMSSKGQVVIPAAVRERLSLDRATEFEVEIDHDKVVLIPRRASDWRAMRGTLEGFDPLSDLEHEHRDELARS